MKSVRVCLLLAGMFFCGTAFLEARDIVREEKEIPAAPGITRVRLNGDIEAADLVITVGDHEAVLKGSFRYDADRGRVEVQYSQEGETLIVDLFQESSKWRYRLDAGATRLELSLSSRYIWEIGVNAGAMECRFDFTGLPLEKLSLDLSAVDGRIEFAGPNPRLLRDFRLDASAGDLKMIGLGYAHFSDLVIDCGAGDLAIDFNGLADGRHRARIDIGAGDIRIDTPDDYPVRIQAEDGWLNSFEMRKRHLTKVDDNTYESSDFDRKDRGLTIDLDIGIGQAVLSREVIIENGTKVCMIEPDRWESYVPVFPSPPVPPEPPLPNFSGEAIGRESIPPIPLTPDIPSLPGMAGPGREDDYRFAN